MKHFSRGTAGDGGATVFRTGLQDKLFHSLADCRGRRGKRSLTVGRRATFEKDRTGPLNAVHRRPAPGRTDCPVENTANIGIEAHGSTIPGCASLTSLFREDGKKRAAIFFYRLLDPSLFQYNLPLPIASMTGSGTTNLTQINGRLWRVGFDQSMRYPSLPPPTVPQSG